MKAILYVGAILMVGASIYGFVDYKRSSPNKKFRSLYDNKEQVVVPQQKTKQDAIKEEPTKIVVIPEEKSNATADIKNSTTIKKKRRITYKEFSRAPLDEKYLRMEIKLAPPKDSIKVEKKEQ